MSDRWRITGMFQTLSPLHIGSGHVTTDPRLLNEKNRTMCDVQEVVKDYQGRPCIPGSAFKGSLRSWADRWLDKDVHGQRIARLFGHKNADDPHGEAGRIEFRTCLRYGLNNTDFAHSAFVPYWNADRTTGIMSHVAIDRDTGTAKGGMLFFEEFVPEGVWFEVNIEILRANEEDVAWFRGVLKAATQHENFPLSFGSNFGNGWGRVRWSCEKLTRIETRTGVASDETHVAIPSIQLIPDNSKIYGLTLKFEGPLLVNDTSRIKKSDSDKNEPKLPNFVALKKANGDTWLPASSFRGSFRSRFEFLAKSKYSDNPKKVEEIVRSIFGDTSDSARLVIEEFNEDRSDWTQSEKAAGTCQLRQQDFVAIDRFTGGASDGAKFDALCAFEPKLKSRLILKNEVSQDAMNFFEETLNDLADGLLGFGFGTSKGYGETKAEIEGFVATKSMSSWQVSKDSALKIQSSAIISTSASSNALTNTKIISAQLTRNLNGQWLIKKNNKGKVITLNVIRSLLPDSIIQGERVAIEIEYEPKKDGQPLRIRERNVSDDSVNSWWNDPNDRKEQQNNIAGNRFCNPYYFVRLQDRTNFKGDLGDQKPPGHSSYSPERYSGKLVVNLTTQSRMVLCGEGLDNRHHPTFKIAVDRVGKPYLASSSVRGMLRSAYEIITNSRFGIFENSSRLGYRSDFDRDVKIIPCLVSGNQIELLPGTTDPSGEIARQPQFAAWVDLQLIKTQELQHRAKVQCWLELWKRIPYDGRFAMDRVIYYWKVRSIALKSTHKLVEPISTIPNPLPHAPFHGYSFHTAVAQDEFETIFPNKIYVNDARLCLTNYNFDRKHDERVFFNLTGFAVKPDLNDMIHSKWEDLIKDYRSNSDFVKKKERPSVLRRAGWSRHFTEVEDNNLSEGSLAYAECVKSGSSWEVKALYPVMIPRKLNELAPVDLQPLKTGRALKINELSPADRVFGWVASDKNTKPNEEPSQLAYKSHVKIGRVRCLKSPEESIEEVTETLAILGQPKPAQSRFYLGNKEGKAQAKGGSKRECGYSKGKRIRGPKVYPHHQANVDQETGVNKDIAYSQNHSDQNRTIIGFVKKNTVFEFDIRFENLSKFELGALVWLLNLPEGHFLRVGYGKPLGFGSVKAQISCGEIYDTSSSTADVQSRYFDEFAKYFENQMEECQDVLNEFLISARGFEQFKIEYPRTRNQDAGRNFRWFVENERRDNQFSLPDLSAKNPSLPIL